MQTIKRFLKDEQGLETVEYAVILGLIVAGTITAIGVLAAWVTGRFESVGTTVEGAEAAGGGGTT